MDGVERANDSEANSAEGLTEDHFTAQEAMRTRAFWMISFGHGSALLVVSASMAHLTLYLTEDRSYTPSTAALIAGLVPVFQFIGTALGGYLGDRVKQTADRRHRDVGSTAQASCSSLGSTHWGGNRCLRRDARPRLGRPWPSDERNSRRLLRIHVVRIDHGLVRHDRHDWVHFGSDHCRRPRGSKPATTDSASQSSHRRQRQEPFFWVKATPPPPRGAQYSPS